MRKALLITSLVSTLFSFAASECANACNGHGKCTSYDMCICNRNWQANDCSERICQYGLAHVDTPKGDLNADGVVSNADIILIENSFGYPFGTTEQFPRMQNSDLLDQTNSAHYYMECSNKGTCNRDTGTCECLDGYDGAACQRASCPGYPDSCSGHGVCKTIRQLASADNDNVYELWDRDVTMGCECDKGFFGADCSLRECKYGVDPLYLDDTATLRHSVWDFSVLTSDPTGNFNNGMTDTGDAYWAIRYYDMSGEDWVTERLTVGASCQDVLNALSNLPNDVVPAFSGTSACTRFAATNGDGLNDFTAVDSLYEDRTVTHKLAFNEPGTTHFNSYDSVGYVYSGYIYRIHFNENPGKARQPEIEIYLDGDRPSIASPGHTITTLVWTDGQAGESLDYFADHCDGVTVKVNSVTADGLTSNALVGLTTAEIEALKTCLGGSDFDSTNNVETYNWDYGSRDYPHIIKLVLSTASVNDGGYYVAVYWDGNNFRLINPFAPLAADGLNSDNYEVYTTKGTFARTANNTQAFFDFGSRSIITANVSYDTAPARDTFAFDGDLSCEVNDNNGYKLNYIDHCLNKSDIVTFLNWEDFSKNPPLINLYTIDRLFTTPFEDDMTTRFTNKKSPIRHLHYGTHTITTDLSLNWAQTVTSGTNYPFYVYKFFPSDDSTYEYVAQCSNRGICNNDEGICECFSGYTGDACQSQSSLAV